MIEGALEGGELGALVCLAFAEEGFVEVSGAFLSTLLKFKVI